MSIKKYKKIIADERINFFITAEWKPKHLGIRLHIHFLGTAKYISHESEMPMAITWKLDHELPSDLYTNFAAVA